MIGIDYVSEITRPRMFCIEGGITIYPSVRTQDRPTDRICPTEIPTVRTIEDERERYRPTVSQNSCWSSRPVRV